MADDEVVIRFSEQNASAVQDAIKGLQEQLDVLAKSLSNVAAAEGEAGSAAGEAGKQSKDLGDRLNNVATAGGTTVDQLRILSGGFMQARAVMRGASLDAATFHNQLGLLQYALRAATTPLGMFTIGIGAAVGAFEMFVARAAGATKEAHEAAKSLSIMSGASIEAASTMSTAVKLAGGDANAFQMALYRLGFEIDSGGKKLADYGVSVRDASGALKEPMQVFEELQAKISSMASATERNAAVQDLFGRAGRRNMVLFNLSTEAMDKNKKTAEELGGITESLAKKQEDLNRSNAVLSEKWQGLWLKYGPAALDIMKKQVEWMTALVGKLEELAAAIAPVVNELFRIGQILDIEGFFTKLFSSLNEDLIGMLRSTRKELEVIGRIIAGLKKIILENPMPGELAKGGWTKFDTAAAEAGLKETGEAIERAEKKKREALEKTKQIANDADKAMNEWRLQNWKDTTEKIIQMETALQVDLARLRTNRAGPPIEVELEGLRQRLALEQQHFNMVNQRRLARSQGRTEALGGTSPEEDEKALAAHAQKILALQGEIGEKQRRLADAQAADRKKEWEQQFNDAKVYTEREIALMEYRRDMNLSFLRMQNLDARREASESARLTESSIRDVAARREALIDLEIAGLQRLASMRREDMALQEEVHDKVQGLQSDRYNLEMQTNKQIYESRKELAQKMRQIALDEAAAGGDMVAAAMSSREKRGLKSHTQAALMHELGLMTARAENDASRFAWGGAITQDQLQNAQTIQGLNRTMIQGGINPYQAMFGFAKSIVPTQAQQFYAQPYTPTPGEPEMPGVGGRPVPPGAGGFVQSVANSAKMFLEMNTAARDFTDTLVNATSAIGAAIAGMGGGEVATPSGPIKGPAASGGPLRAEKDEAGNVAVTNRAGALPAGGGADPLVNLARRGVFIDANRRPVTADGLPWLPSYDVGSWNIPRTGPAMLHAGEMVIPQDAAEKLRYGNLSPELIRKGYVLDEGGRMIRDPRRVDAEQRIETAREQLDPNSLTNLRARNAMMQQRLDQLVEARTGRETMMQSMYEREPREQWAGSLVNSRLDAGAGIMSEGYTGAFKTIEAELDRLEFRLSSRLRGMNVRVRDHIVSVIKSELPIIFQQQGARR